MNDNERIARGLRYDAAREVLDETFEGVRAYMLTQLEQASPSRPDDILELHRGLNTLAKLRHAMTLAIGDGLVAEQAAGVARLNRA